MKKFNQGQVIEIPENIRPAVASAMTEAEAAEMAFKEASRWMRKAARKLFAVLNEAEPALNNYSYFILKSQYIVIEREWYEWEKKRALALWASGLQWYTLIWWLAIAGGNSFLWSLTDEH